MQEFSTAEAHAGVGRMGIHGGDEAVGKCFARAAHPEDAGERFLEDSFAGIEISGADQHGLRLTDAAIVIERIAEHGLQLGAAAIGEGLLQQEDRLAALALRQKRPAAFERLSAHLTRRGLRRSKKFSALSSSKPSTSNVCFMCGGRSATISIGPRGPGRRSARA